MNKREKHFPSAAACQDAFEPGAYCALEREVHQQEKRADEQHGGQDGGIRHDCANGHGRHPTDGSERGKIRHSVSETDDVKRAQAERKPQQGAKFKAYAKPGRENGEELPEKKNSPEEQSNPAFSAVRQKGISTEIESDAKTEHEQPGENAGKNHSNQIPLIVFLAEIVPQDPPAEASDKPDLFPNARKMSYISHESSSSCGRWAPSWPTMERKICSRVVLLPSSPAIPARSSSSEPCATSRPL